jgi:hypothetical protein
MADLVPIPNEDEALKAFLAPEPQPQPEPAAPQPQGVDSLDALLAEYDQGTKAPPEQTPTVATQEFSSPDPLADTQLDSALTGIDRQISDGARSLFEVEQYKSQLADAFNQHCSRGQERLPDHAPADYFRDQLLAMSTTNPALEIAFEAQFVDRTAIGAQLDLTNLALAHARQNPAADPQKIAALQQDAWRLNIALNAGRILQQAGAEIVRKASRPPVDREITSDVALIAQSMKGSSRPVEAEPPPAFGRMDDQSFRKFTRENYGF